MAGKVARQTPIEELMQQLENPSPTPEAALARDTRHASSIDSFRAPPWPEDGHHGSRQQCCDHLGKAGPVMQPTWRPNYLIGFYFSMLLILLLCVSTTPLLIRHGLTLSDHFIIEEEFLETALILALFGISFLILIQVMHRLKAYREAVERALFEKSKLVGRLADAFRYIGKVNLEIQEIESALGGAAIYPQSKKEYRALIDRLASRALTVSCAPWLTVRMIDRQSGRTVNEHGVHHSGEPIPSTTMGNRAILNGIKIDGLQMVGPRQQNLDLLTVMIFPSASISREKNILLTAILNQIEMLFILYRAGCTRPKHTCGHTVPVSTDDPNRRNPHRAGEFSR